MASNNAPRKQLGEFIERCDEFNDGMEISELLGISNQKFFQKGKTNTIGVDLSKYRIVRSGQFAFNRATTRNGDKISIALREGEDCICSPSYRIFRSKDENILNSRYLMMWFLRPEFDRYARYKSHGSAHEFFEWDEMCEVELPVPPIAQQREIVAEYRAVTDRIALLGALNAQLEETAQAVFREMFGGYSVDRPEELPEGWRVGTVASFCREMKNGATPSRDNPGYWTPGEIPWLKTGEIDNNIILSAEEFISQEGFKNSSTKLLPANTVLMAMYGATAGKIGFLKFETTTNQACCAMICKNPESAAFLYYHLLARQADIKSLANGGAQENLSKQIIESELVLVPNTQALETAGLLQFIEARSSNSQEIQSLTKLKNLLLARMAGV